MELDLLGWWRRLRRNEDAREQVAALPYAFIDGRVAFLLITSRRRGRWIVPKGNLIDGLTHAESAQREALEEAGVEGEIATTPLGQYETTKNGRRTTVALYPLHVRHQHDTWDENGQRYRHWVLLPEARRLLADRHLVGLVAGFHRRMQAKVQPETNSVISQ